MRIFILKGLKYHPLASVVWGREQVAPTYKLPSSFFSEASRDVIGPCSAEGESLWYGIIVEEVCSICGLSISSVLLLEWRFDMCPPSAHPFANLSPHNWHTYSGFCLRLMSTLSMSGVRWRMIQLSCLSTQCREYAKELLGWRVGEEKIQRGAGLGVRWVFLTFFIKV